MRALIPVAGEGTRLRPHTYTVPKVLLNVAGKPILGHILDGILAANITELTIIIGHLGDRIREYVTTYYPSLNVEFIEQKERLGLGHAIYSARTTLNATPTLIILGDTIFDANLKRMIESTYSQIGVKHVDNPKRFGIVETENGFITKMIEKPENPLSTLAIVGIYFIKNTLTLIESLDFLIRNDIKTRGEYQLTDALQIMVERGEKMCPFLIDGWYDCGKPETLLATNHFLLTRQAHNTYREGCVIKPPTFIAPTAIIEHAILGPNVTIADGAIVRNSIIQNSIINASATVENALLNNSIVGNNAIVRGMYKCMNIGDSSELEIT
ncbi:MAG: sugar phosphate nucleotidyltransferase [Bacteroidetes bacterium]|nr:sugar phosphate nucleotidyltransferase [Bacteroidota bacterium]